MTAAKAYRRGRTKALLGVPLQQPAADKLLQLHTNGGLEKRTPTKLQSTITPQHLDVPLI